MQIPLDYYRILGVPIQVSDEKLQQAYRDRTLQLPRREYTDAAIAARKQLLTEAYAILSDPQQRHQYNIKYFSRSYDQEVTNTAIDASGDLIELPAAPVPHTPSIEVDEELFIGALLILQELGEYQIVLNLGNSYFSNTNIELEDNQESYPIQSDVVLTIALAYLEFGREQWQQEQYEKAATFLENGQKFLLRENLFLNVRNQIQSELYKLRPYRILELLAKSENNVAERYLGLQLLQDILQQRHGIDGTGDDGSGLGIDDFLRFIQQVRNYLTVAEQQNLFVAESQRPSAVATYLAVYTLIARGFSQRQPNLICEAKLLLISLGKRQDVCLEQAVCSLLLGQTVAATRELEFSQEYESLALIREHSQNAPDLLPGLCLYTERWLQTEVFPQFRDLVHQKAALKNYFADRHVQAYLEALPIQGDLDNEKVAIRSDSPNYSQATPAHQSSREQHAQSATNTITVKSKPRTEEKFLSLTPGSSSQTATSTSSTIVPSAERIIQTTSGNTNTLTSARPSLPRSQRRTQINRGLGICSNVPKRFSKQVSNTFKAKKTRLVLLGIGGLLSLVILGFLINRTYAWLRQTFVSKPLPEELVVRLDRPLLLIPDPNSVLPATESMLTPVMAKQVIQNWLYTKNVAFGSNHAVAELEKILVQPVLPRWQRLVQNDQANNIYRQYKHSLKIDSVRSEAPGDRAQVEASVNEIVQVYDNGKLNQKASYNDNLRVRYDLVRQDGQWRIREMKVLN